MMLHVWNHRDQKDPRNRSATAVAAPGGAWWGEGDEKFFVDGEHFPSTFGTGTEDYFGYAWGGRYAGFFQTPYHGQPMTQSNLGHQSLLRWQVADNVPFQTSFEASMEKYYPNDWPTRFACVACWYLAPGGDDPHRAVPVEERTGYYQPGPVLPPQPSPYLVPGALEGESLSIRSTDGGETLRQTMRRRAGKYSRNTQLWWRDASPGDTLVLEVPVRESGQYELLAQLTKARDYAIVQLRLDGKALGEPIDLYHATVVPTGELSFGKHALSAGSHRLTVEIIGANRAALPRHMFGLDYLRLKSVP
jgi:hypothetical protein